jgi:MOSC domain-containing protein YiiM
MPQPRSYLHQISVSNGGVPKLPVPEARITSEGVVGDRQKNRDVHGGVDRAVCIFSLELIEALQSEGHSITPGSSGENLTIAGVAWSELKPGNWLRIGQHVLLEIKSYTSPCKYNAQWFVGGNFSRISQKLHPGWSRLYARVLQQGLVRAGDSVSVETTGSIPQKS